MLSDLSEISVLDMAGRLSSLLGFQRNPSVRFTGMRPGERLREELLSANESFASAEIAGIACVAHCGRDAQLNMTIPSFQDQLDLAPDALTNLVMDLARLLQ